MENGSKLSLVAATYDEDEEQTERKFPDWSEAMKKAPYADPSYYRSSDEEEVEELNNNEKGAGELNNLEITVMEKRDHYIQVQRAGAHEAQKKSVSSNQRYAPAEVGKIVRLPIDPVDHPKIGLPNLLGVVMEVDNGFYKSEPKTVFFLNDSLATNLSQATTIWEYCICNGIGR